MTASPIAAVASGSSSRTASSRASGYYTREDLESFMDDYTTLLNKYGHGDGGAPPGARLMQLRMFYIPDEPADPEP